MVQRLQYTPWLVPGILVHKWVCKGVWIPRQANNNLDKPYVWWGCTHISPQPWHAAFHTITWEHQLCLSAQQKWWLLCRNRNVFLFKRMLCSSSWSGDNHRNETRVSLRLCALVNNLNKASAVGSEGMQLTCLYCLYWKYWVASQGCENLINLRKEESEFAPSQANCTSTAIQVSYFYIYWNIYISLFNKTICQEVISQWDITMVIVQFKLPYSNENPSASMGSRNFFIANHAVSHCNHWPLTNSVD